MQPPNKERASDLSKTEDQLAYVLEAHNAEALLHKELDVNLAEQGLLNQRMKMSKIYLNDLPSTDPNYTSLATQTQMDLIELDELKRREELISDRLKSFM
jgi:hypothetical protein